MPYLNRKAVGPYLIADPDVLSVIETDLASLFATASMKRAKPWHLYLCSEINLNRNNKLEADVPHSREATAAYLCCGDEFTYSEFSLEWSEYHKSWYVRVVEAREGEIIHDNEDCNRHTKFDKAWEAFCGVSAENEAVKPMMALYSMTIKPEVKSPPVKTPPRPSNFGNWS